MEKPAAKITPRISARGSKIVGVPTKKAMALSVVGCKADESNIISVPDVSSQKARPKSASSTSSPWKVARQKSFENIRPELLYLDEGTSGAHDVVDTGEYLLSYGNAVCFTQKLIYSVECGRQRHAYTRHRHTHPRHRYTYSRLSSLEPRLRQ
jgi:hypothetical protein